MNKKLNTVVFVLGATIFNLIVMLVLFAVPMVLLIVIFGERLQQAYGILSVLLFFGALVGSFFLYGFLMKKISTRYNLDEYLHPIFKRKR